MQTRHTASKVLLVAEGRASGETAPAVPIRRFRIARVRPENRPLAGRPRIPARGN